METEGIPGPAVSVRAEHGLNRTVIGAGVTSALGDLGYETANVILPGFLAVLGVPASVLGAIEGVADATSSFMKLAAGYVSDRLGIRKSLVVLGYALTPVGQAFIALAAGWPLILLGRVLGWFGRGVRGPLRDAIIAEAITPETRGRAFGFHRAADTLGAVIGPLLGVALLSVGHRLYPADPAQPFRFVLWLTVIPGALSVASFAVLVRDDRTVPNRTLRFLAAIRGLPRRFRRYLTAVGLFGMGDYAHTLLILAATQALSPELGVVHAAEVAGLLYVERNIVQTVASWPIGALADRWGHRSVLIFGYALGAATAAGVAAGFLMNGPRLPVFVVVFAGAGLYIGIQEALEASLTAEYVPLELRGISYGVLGSVNGVGDLVSSVAVGTLWTAITPTVAFGFAATVMLAGTLGMALLRSDDAG